MSELHEGMRIDWDIPIRMRDGAALRADIFRPPGSARVPALVTCGPYGKGLTFAAGYADAWDMLVSEHPEVCDDSTGRYVTWETPDPEKWVPHGYAIVRADARGWGRSPGFVEPYSSRDARDLYECIEWAAAQGWCTGRVGLLGISYYAITQWLVAQLHPPHLEAIVPWEGLADSYRDSYYHGGILSTSVDVWYERLLRSVQHGLGSHGPVSDMTGEPVTGPETLSDEHRAANRSNYPGRVRGHAIIDEFHCERSVRWEDVQVPLLAAGNWGGAAKHLRGATEAFTRAASAHKWLEIHGGPHWTSFYSAYGVSLQRRFLDHFLKDEGDWLKQARVHLRIRTLEGMVDRDEHEWPLARTRWTRRYLDATDGRLGASPGGDASVAYDPLEEGVTFVQDPLEEETEITGPLAARLYISSASTDADLFLVLRAFAPDGREVVSQGAVDPHTPIGQGWLRASHRKLDKRLSTESRPVHTHDEVQPLIPGRVYELQVEIWPTCIVLPPGHRIALTVLGRDYQYTEGDATGLSHFEGTHMRGSGIYVHDDPVDRPREIYGQPVTLHTGARHPSSVLLPVIPPR